MIMTGEGVSDYEFRRVCCICVLFSLLAGCASESLLMKKRKKLKPHKVLLIKTFPATNRQRFIW